MIALELHPHPYQPGLFVTRDGRVFVECLPSDAQSGGYFNVTVPPANGNGRGYRKRRATIVAETFDRQGRPGEEVRHLDGIPANDIAGNVVWGTHVENMADMVAHDRSIRGVRNPSARLTEAQAREIIQRLDAGEG